MNSLEIFQLALNLTEPWYVSDVKFDESSGKNQLHIEIKRKKRHVFSECAKVHDKKERTWRQLNFFEHECFLYASVPRVRQ